MEVRVPSPTPNPNPDPDPSPDPDPNQVDGANTAANGLYASLGEP